MAIAAQVMGGGFSQGQALAIGGSVRNSISAAGTVITDATDLTGSINVVTTWAANAGVQLPNAMIGDEVEVLNLGVGAGYVYPPASTAQINALPVGTGFILAPNTAVKVKKFTATRWVAYLSA